MGDPDSPDSVEFYQRFYRALFESSPDLVAVAALPSLRLVQVNAAFARVTGYAADDLTTRHFLDLIPVEDQDGAAEALRSPALRAADTVHPAKRLRLADGSDRWVEWTSYAFADDRQILIVGRDITVQKDNEEALRASTEHFAKHLEHTPVAVIEWDLDFRIQAWNPAAEQTFGYTADEVLGRRGTILLTPDVRETVLKTWRQLKQQTGGSRSTNENLHRDGRIILCEWSNTPLLDANGQVTSVASMARDITAVREREQELVAARNRAEEANRAKSTFLARMSHELRTPLNAIIGPAEILAAEVEGAEKRELAQLLAVSAEHLLALINDLLDLSRIESGRLDVRPEPVELRSFLSERLAPLARMAERKGLAFRTECAAGVPRHLLVDARLLLQILLNLIGNSIKFTPAGSVRISVHLEPDEPETLVFAVSDSGPGIPEEELANIFEPFKRVDPHRGDAEGAGLGLAICQQVAEKLGGRLAVESRLGVGCCFTLRLPALIPSGETPTPPAPAVSSPAEPLDGDCPGRLLVVEDDAASRRVLSAFLDRLGCTFDLAKSGEEALRVVDPAKHRIILMDMQLPGIDGLTTIQSLRAGHAGYAPYIIAQTAYALSEQKARILACGADAFITKPVRKNALQEALGAAVRVLAERNG